MTLEPMIRDVTLAAFDFTNPSCYVEPQNCDHVATKGRSAPSGLAKLARKVARVLPLYAFQCSHGDGVVFIDTQDGDALPANVPRDTGD